ncbi:flavodoxin family protein [Christensenellaceae bacterium OttesenSCG-928-M15]|nr:flavodoxin family protein [Christensenellaceae bacterium OttesenSCG-928-M15]
MGKKILVINGSPRKQGNTELLVDAFLEGVRESGHEAHAFHLHEMNVHPCIGCLRGGKNPESPCVQKDDMDKLYPLYQAADVVVLASPMYYWGFTAQLKMVIDRLFAVTEAKIDTRNKESVLLIAAEGDDEENNAPVRAYYETLIKYLGWADKGQLFAGGVYEIGDIKGRPVLEEAKKLGASLR